MNLLQLARRASILSLATITLACGSNGGTAPNDDDDDDNGAVSSFRATIAGVAWQAVPEAIISAYDASANSYIIAGVDVNIGGQSRAVLINLTELTGTGTYSLNSADPFRYANTSRGEDVWEAFGAGSSGTVTVTIATATRFAGTFSFTAVPGEENADQSVVSVTNGTFDILIGQ